MGKKVIITGGNGFAGRYLIAELQKNWPGVNIMVWDTNLAGLLPGVAGLQVDITKPDTYKKSLEGIKPGWLIHMAAIAFVGKALKYPELTHAINVEGTRLLLESVKALSPSSKVFVTSSADIYGANSAEPLPEMSLDDCKPPNPYAVSKWEMENMIEKDFKAMVLRVRPFSHIGPGQSKDFVTGAFASQVADIEAHAANPTPPGSAGHGAPRDAGWQPVIKVGNLKAKRDFTDVRDMVRAYRLLMEKGAMGEVYNIGSGRAIAVQAILDGLLAAAKVKIAVEEDPARMRPSDTPILFGDITKLKMATGWEPEIPFEQTLQEILDYWRAKARTS